MACDRKCGVLVTGIIVLLVGVLFLIMGGIVRDVVNKGIDSGIAESVSVRYDRGWSSTDQQKWVVSTNDYDYHGFDITNLEAVLQGTAKFNLSQTGPFYYREYSYKENVTYENTDSGEVISFNLWWRSLPKNDSNASDPTDNAYARNTQFETVPITLPNPVYLNLVYGLRALINDSLQAQVVPVGEGSALTYLASNGGIYKIYEYFTSLAPGNFPTLLKMLAMSNGALASVTDANGLINAFTAVAAQTLSTTEATLLMNNNFPYNNTYIKSNAAIGNWYGAITETRTYPKDKPALIAILASGLAGDTTAANALFAKVRTFLLTPNAAAFSGFLGNLRSSIPDFQSNWDGSDNNVGFQVLGKLQMARSTFTKATLAGAPSIDPNYNKQSDPRYANVYFGLELANYNVVNVSADGQATLDNLDALFLLFNDTNTAASIALSSNFGRVDSVKSKIGNNYNVTNFNRYFFQVLPSYGVLRSVTDGNGGLFTKRPLSQVYFGYPLSANDPLLATTNRTFDGLGTNMTDKEDGFKRVPGRYAYYTGRGVDTLRSSMYYNWRGIGSFYNLTDWPGKTPLDCQAIWSNGNTKCNIWKNPEVIRGSSTTSYYGPGLDKDPSRQLKLWNSETARVINFSVVGPSVVKGIKTLTYEIDPLMLKNTTENENYYITVDGVAPVSRTSNNIPFHVSRPHLYTADPSLQTRVTGLNTGLNDSEVRRLYWTEIDVEPQTGAAVRGDKKLQMNILLKKSDFVKDTRYSRMWDAVGDADIYLPIMWLNQHAIVNDTDAADAVDKLNKIDKARDIASSLRIAGFVVGSVLCAVSFVLFGYYYKLSKGSTGTSQLKSSTELYVGK